MKLKSTFVALTALSSAAFAQSNVGIGFSGPLSKLSVNGGLSVGQNVAAPTGGALIKGNVGIGAATAPAATLDVTGTPGTASVMDGIIAPRITAAQLSNKSYGAAQDGALVYVTDAATGTSQASDVSGAGLYYFNNGTSKWVKAGAAAGSGNIYTTNGTLGGNRIVTQGANTLSFTSSATNGFSVDGSTLSVDAANNRVGIGTTSPSYALDINDPVPNGYSFQMRGSYNGVLQGARFVNTSNNKNFYIVPGYDYSGLGNGTATTIDTEGVGVLVIADDVIPDGNALRTLGHPSRRYGALYLSSAPNVSSDSRLKSNVAGLKYGLDDVLKMRPVTYTLNADKENKTQVGFIAQEMLKVVPEVVTLGEKSKDEEPMYGMKYEQLIPVLTKAIQEQQAQIEALKKEVAALKK